MPETMGRPKLLCVDDDPQVLEGLALHLRRRFEVDTAVGGVAGLAAIARDGAPAVVISDMRMPGMDGAAFLSQVRHTAPDTVRMLLTGQADVDSAIAAVNEGQIFRFLTKPCPPSALLAAVTAAIEQHRLITAERVLLEQTLHGSIQTLADVLSITNPLLFGRATRIKTLVSEMAERMGLHERWQVEVAAMLSQLGCVALPHDVAEKVYYGKPLSEKEQAMVARVPETTEQLLAHIPRLDVVRGILNHFARTGHVFEASDDPAELLMRRGVQMLRVALDFDALETSGLPPVMAMVKLRECSAKYDDDVLSALFQLCGNDRAGLEVIQIPTETLRVGLVLAEDLVLETGSMLVARGYTVTAGFIERLRNFRPGTVKEHVLVFLPKDLEKDKVKARAS